MRHSTNTAKPARAPAHTVPPPPPARPLPHLHRHVVRLHPRRREHARLVRLRSDPPPPQPWRPPPAPHWMRRGVVAERTLGNLRLVLCQAGGSGRRE